TAAGRLCANYLISPAGRRLSVEESEIMSQLRLSPEVLRHLVSSRLLRCDSRAESMYYELSHDALIEPVLATRQARGFLLGSLGLVAGGISWLVTLAVLVITGFLFIAAVFNTLFTIFDMEPPPEWDWTTNDVI